MNDDLANGLAVCLAHFAERLPPLIVANCVYGTGEDGLGCSFSIFVPSQATVAQWATEPEADIVELIAESKRQGLRPAGAIRFLIPGSVIERCGVRDAVRTCMQKLAEAAEEKIAPSDEVNGLPIFYCGLVEASSQGNDEDSASDEW